MTSLRSIPTRWSASRRKSGFSLVELLVVVAIMALFGAVTVPSLAYLTAGKFNATTSKTADLLEVARQYAVAHNTYTWVAFYSAPGAANSPATVYAAMLASTDGTAEAASGSSFGSAAAWPNGITASTGANSSANCQLIGKIESFPQTSLAESGTLALPSLPAVSQLAGPATDAPSFSLAVPGRGTQTFDRAIQFTPSGEAKVQATTLPAIEFGLRHMNGTTPSNNLVAVMRINGYTGLARVYLP